MSGLVYPSPQAVRWACTKDMDWNYLFERDQKVMDNGPQLKHKSPGYQFQINFVEILYREIKCDLIIPLFEGHGQNLL
jgi:hypothetical protein